MERQSTRRDQYCRADFISEAEHHDSRSSHGQREFHEALRERVQVAERLSSRLGLDCAVSVNRMLMRKFPFGETV